MSRDVVDVFANSQWLDCQVTRPLSHLRSAYSRCGSAESLDCGAASERPLNRDVGWIGYLVPRHFCSYCRPDVT